MKKEQIRTLTAELYAQLPGNLLQKEMNIRPEYAGIRMFDAPIIGFCSADDPLFAEFKKDGVVGPWHMSPKEWLPEAETVISFFFPMGPEVRKSNREAEKIASELWTYARIEGQEYVSAFMKAVAAWFESRGLEACVPSADPRWQQLAAGQGIEGYPEIRKDSFGSRWSERHAAYACGLGIFGLSRGLITEKGMAGRFGSIVVSAAFEPDKRPYAGVYDYCIRCGACVQRCPAHAIDLERGKNHMICAPYVMASKAVYGPRYGCGLCQTGVPCEAGIPLRAPAAEQA